MDEKVKISVFVGVSLDGFLARENGGPLMMEFRRILFFLLAVTAFPAVFAAGRAPGSNAFVAYLDGAELQYEGDAQKKNITEALNDALSLSKADLKAKRYADYSGKPSQWDFPTVIRRHFVPASAMALDENIYDDLKTPAAQKRINRILSGLGSQKTNGREQMEEQKTLRFTVDESRSGFRMGTMTFAPGAAPVLELNGDTPDHQKLKAEFEALLAKESLHLETEEHEGGNRKYGAVVIHPGDKNYGWAVAEALRWKGFKAEFRH